MSNRFTLITYRSFYFLSKYLLGSFLYCPPIIHFVLKQFIKYLKNIFNEEQKDMTKSLWVEYKNPHFKNRQKNH